MPNAFLDLRLRMGSGKGFVIFAADHNGAMYDPLGGATSFVSVLSLPFLIDELVPRLAAAVDGDPATPAQ